MSYRKREWKEAIESGTWQKLAEDVSVTCSAVRNAINFRLIRILKKRGKMIIWPTREEGTDSDAYQKW